MYSARTLTDKAQETQISTSNNDGQAHKGQETNGYSSAGTRAATRSRKRSAPANVQALEIPDADDQEVGVQQSITSAPDSTIFNDHARPLIDVIRTHVSSHDLIIPSPLSNSLICASPSESSDNGINSSPPVLVAAESKSSVKAKPKVPAIICREDLNWCDADEIDKNLEFFDDDQKRFMKIRDMKFEHYSDGIVNGSYFDNLLPIICSGYARAEKIVHCGNSNLGRKLPCDQWSLCSICAYVKGVQASIMYQGSYDKAHFYHVTLGFDQDIAFGTESSVDAQTYWKANRDAISALLSNDLIDGVYMSHELSIRSLLPLRVNPHSHAIVTAKNFPPEVQQALAEKISSYEGVNLAPSIQVNLIDSERYHDQCIRYLTKAIELKRPYDSAWNRHCTDNRKAAREINLEMRTFLDAQAAALQGFDRISRMGNMMPQRKDFIGVPKNKRPTSKNSIAYKLKNRSQLKRAE